MVNFEINDNYGEVSLMYTVDSCATLDDVAIKMVKAQTPNFLIPFSIVYFNDTRTIKYDVKRYTSLQNYISTPLNRYNCINLFLKLLSPFMDCVDWLLDGNLLYMDIEKVYFDHKENTIKYLYIPVVNQRVNEKSFKEFFQNIAINIKNSSGYELNNMMNEIIVKLVGDDFSIESLYSYFKELLENSSNNSTPVVEERPVVAEVPYVTEPVKKQPQKVQKNPIVPPVSKNNFINIPIKPKNQPIINDDIDVEPFPIENEDSNATVNKLKNFFGGILHKGGKSNNSKPIISEDFDVPNNSRQPLINESFESTPKVQHSSNSGFNINPNSNSSFNNSIGNQNINIGNNTTQVNVQDIFDSATITSDMVSNINRPNIVLSLVSSMINGVPESINININTDNNSYTMGRKDLLTDISRQDTNVGRISKIHARFTRSQNGYNITDISSGNYVFINDVLIANNIPKSININDTISLGIFEDKKIVTYRVTYCD